MIEVDSPETKPTRRQIIVRCLPAVVLLFLGFMALVAIQTTEFSITGKPTRDITWIIGITEVAIYVWMRALAGVSLRTQVTTLALLYGLQLAAYATVRIDGFMGDGRPIVVWRWTPGTDQNWQDKQPADNNQKPTLTADFSKHTLFDYPGFRGHDRMGIMRTLNLAREWPQPPKLLWRKPIGLGWSSFAVVGNYCVTQEQRGEFETVVCYEVQTGREIWIHSDLASFDEVTGGKGPRATPTIHNGRVYALGATGILNCLDGRDGRRIWSRNILDDNNAQNALFGMSGSPLVINGLVVVSPGGKAGSLTAYNQQTGQRVWAGGKAQTSYSSPQFADFVEQPLVLNFNAEGLFGHDVNSGEVMWSFPWVSNPAERNNVCQPVVLTDDDQHPNQIFISSGYGQGCALIEIVRDESRHNIHEHWRNRNLKAKFSSVVRRGKHIYGLDGNILACIDLANGKRNWKRGRYGYGQLAIADDLLVVQAESGEIVLVEATPERHQELARFTALDDRTWNHPVVVGDLLLVRNDREAACYQLPLAISEQ